MNRQSFSTSILLDKSPEEVFRAICNVRGWWSEEVEGDTEKLNDEFRYHYRDVHRCTMRLEEVVPGRKMIWRVLDNYFNFVKNQEEWMNTRVVFEITTQDGKTKLDFSHEGLYPDFECYEICANAWTGYIEKSLPDLIATGKGQPNPKEEN